MIALAPRVMVWARKVSWLLPVPMLPFTGVVTLWPLAAVVHRPTSAPRLLVEAFATTLAVIGVVQLAWIAPWMLEQR